MATPYTGSSIVDYLSSTGQRTDYASRASLAQSKGIQNYTGTAEQNTNLLNMLRGPGSASVSPAAPARPPVVSPAPVAPVVQPQVAATAPAGQPIAPSAGGGDLVSALVAKGYSQTDAQNAASGPRAAELSREYLGGGAAGTGVAGFGAPPTLDLNAVTQAAYNTPEILAAQSAVTERQAALAKASADINDNPFYSEATRVGKLAKLTAQANDDIKVQENLLASLKADAAIKVNAATGQYNIQNDQYKQTLNTFNNLISAGGLTNASTADLANYSVMTGLPISVLQSIQETQKQKNVETQLVTANDGSISVVNTKTGEVMSTTQPGVGPRKTTGGSGSTAKDTKDLFLDDTKTITGQATPDGGWFGEFPQLVKKYAPLLSLQDIYRLYAQSDLGRKFGQPKESAADVQELYNAYRKG